MKGTGHFFMSSVLTIIDLSASSPTEGWPIAVHKTVGCLPNDARRKWPRALSPTRRKF